MGKDAAASSTEYWSALALAVGSLGVVVVAICYALSPAEAVLPFPAPVMPQALDGAIAGAIPMRTAGFVGVIFDVIACVGALGLLLVRTAPAERLGWAAFAVSGIVFCIVDAMVGSVLPQTAAWGDDAVFIALKRLFDILFVLGTFAFGVALVGVFASLCAEGGRILGGAGIVVGAVGIVAALAHLSGIAVALPIGFTILIGAVFLVLFGLRIIRTVARVPFAFGFPDG